LFLCVFYYLSREGPRFVYIKLKRFIDGDEVVRKKKLEVMLQLEIDKNGLSFLERCLLWWLLFLLRFTVRIRYCVPKSNSTSDRTSLPPLILSDCGDTFHFGGSLQSNEMMLNNYVATTAHLASSRNCNLITRMMLSYIELGGLSRNVADVSFILAGEDENELPERAMCTSRTVRATLTKLPISFVSEIGNTSPVELEKTAISKSDKGIASLIVKLLVIDPAVAATEAMIRSMSDFPQLPALFSPNRVVHPKMPENYNYAEQASIDDSATEPFQQAINKLISILEGITVPVRAREIIPVKGNEHRAEGVSTLEKTDYEQIPILQTVSRSDITRFFVASNCNPKEASARIVESAIWRGMTFPIDVRMCRIELQVGQFFHQGFDLMGNPVFYFRNMCLGPWRKDDDAVIAAVLHRLEYTLKRLSQKNPFVQCTLIILAGKPYKRKYEGKARDSNKSESKDANEDRLDQSTIASTALSTITGTVMENESMDRIINNDGEEVKDDEHDSIDSNDKNFLFHNPRMFHDEHWNVHTSKSMIERLVNILLTHYPERLGKALVIVGHGNKKYARSSIGGLLYLTSLVASTRTRDKVRLLTRYRDLQSYVHRSQLVTLAGGTQMVDAAHYECI
jgi:hypothetical protein